MGCAQGRCATRLRYAPTSEASLILNHFQNFRHHRQPKSQKRSDRGTTRTTLVCFPVQFLKRFPEHGPSAIPATVAQASTATLHHVGIGTFRTRPCMPTRSTAVPLLDALERKRRDLGTPQPASQEYGEDTQVRRALLVLASGAFSSACA